MLIAFRGVGIIAVYAGARQARSVGARTDGAVPHRQSSSGDRKMNEDEAKKKIRALKAFYRHLLMYAVFMVGLVV